MIKGCSRRVIYLKNTDSTMFDEAYFLLSSGQPSTKVGEADMIREAERIVSESSGAEPASVRAGRGGRFWFCVGCVCATAFYMLLGALLYILGIWSV